MNQDFLKVSLRQKAIFIPQNAIVAAENAALRETTATLVANLANLGFGLSENLLHTLNRTNTTFQTSVLTTIAEVMGMNKNWTPLVKNWDIPTGETVFDHIITFFTNIFEGEGTTLPCGHIIPPNTFPLERYNGCPFCGTPFKFGKTEKIGQSKNLKVLDLWTEVNISTFFNDLLSAKTALDATQIDSLKILLVHLPAAQVSIGMKETLMLVLDTYLTNGQAEKAQKLITSPTDILRFLWYKHTGFLQIIEPKTLIKRQSRNHKHVTAKLDESANAKIIAKNKLKLKYSRKESKVIAQWLNKLPISAEKASEIMHPKRQIWVRFIRALRLAEYSKKQGFEPLKNLLDVFYKEKYPVYLGQIETFRLKMDAENTFNLLKQRPGYFARALFASMLWFGKNTAIQAFTEIINKVPARLLFTLNMYAGLYFSKNGNRSVKPLGGVNKMIPKNKLIELYDHTALAEMQDEIANLCLLAMKKRFAALPNTNKTIYIAPVLFKMPVSIGDRSETIQDMPSALTGTKFDVQGDAVRLFMQWGEGLPAQHLDMDLSCRISYDDKFETCFFGNLVTAGCKHSGDIRSIPEQIGTAEYIEINLPELKNANVKYVTFTCNAYSGGSITPNLVVGWMTCENQMQISAETGVAYDPSCVQHQVRITNNLTKGLIFGVLDVEKSEIVWIEMPFSAQTALTFDTQSVETLLKKLDSKLSIGNLLKLKAEAQNLQIVENIEADEVYTFEWGMNAAAVSKLLVD